MKRTKWIAAAWIAGFTVSALAATVVLVGCCVLPFHGLIHKAAPLCDIAAHVMRGEHGDDGHHGAKAAPVPQKREDVSRVVRFLRPAADTPRTVVVLGWSPATTPAAFRSFITLGAARCDDDIGRRLAGLEDLRI